MLLDGQLVSCCSILRLRGQVVIDAGARVLARCRLLAPGPAHAANKVADTTTHQALHVGHVVVLAAAEARGRAACVYLFVCLVFVGADSQSVESAAKVNTSRKRGGKREPGGQRAGWSSERVAVSQQKGALSALRTNTDAGRNRQLEKQTRRKTFATAPVRNMPMDSAQVRLNWLIDLRGNRGPQPVVGEMLTHKAASTPTARP